MITASELKLAPIPKKMSTRKGAFLTKWNHYIHLSADDPRDLLPAANKVELDWEITASPAVPQKLVGLSIRLDKKSGIPSQGYKLTITPKGMEILSSDPAGAFYGACTLGQILMQCDGEVPCLSITDSPDFPARGVMLDISRDKVPTMDTLYYLVDLLADWKINQLQLYTEHTFAYTAHPTVWEQASPMTGGEIMALDAYCKEKFIELVPNQNSFGHMERWFKHKKYLPLAEAPHGCEKRSYPTGLNPTDKRSIQFLQGLYDELLPHFTSKQINVGCDETWDLGCGKSKKRAKEIGPGRLYLEFLLKIHEAVKGHDRKMMFWGDIILHHPELIKELPKDIIALEWGYEFDSRLDEESKKFAKSKIPFYICPGTSSWGTLVGRTDNAIANITLAAKSGLKNGAIGILNTDWGDCGHWQPLSVSYLPYMVGAMASWNATKDVKKCIADCASLHAFGDRTGKMGKAFYDLGNLYTSFAKRTWNHSVPWKVLFDNKEKAVEGLKMEEFDEMERRLDLIGAAMEENEMTCIDAEVVVEEFEHLMRLLQLSAEVGKHRLGGHKPRNLEQRAAMIRLDQETIWLLRNRMGGLADSLSKIAVGLPEQ